MRLIVLALVIIPKISLTEDEGRLNTLLFSHNNYDKSVRPVKNYTHPIEVKMSVNLIDCHYFDAKNQILDAHMWISYEWTDEFLIWDPSDFNGIEVPTVRRTVFTVQIFSCVPQKSRC